MAPKSLSRRLLRLYPRKWRERYGEELLSILGDRARLRDVIDVFHGAASEWVSQMTGNGYWNDQAQRTTRALAQAAAGAIAFQTFVPPIVSALVGRHLFGSSTLGAAMLWGFVSSLLQSAVTLGPVAVVMAAIPWRDVPHARLAAGLTGGLIALRIGHVVAWGPAELVAVLAGVWIGYRTVSIEPALRGEVILD